MEPNSETPPFNTQSGVSYQALGYPSAPSANPFLAFGSSAPLPVPDGPLVFNTGPIPSHSAREDLSSVYYSEPVHLPAPCLNYHGFDEAPYGGSPLDTTVGYS